MPYKIYDAILTNGIIYQDYIHYLYWCNTITHGLCMKFITAQSMHNS